MPSSISKISGRIAVEIEKGPAERRILTQVNADDLEGVAVEVEERRGLAGTSILTLTGFDHQALPDEVGDEVGNGDAGEPGFPCDVGPAELTLAIKGLHDEGAIVSARVLREHLRGRPQFPAVAEALSHVC